MSTEVPSCFKPRDDGLCRGLFYNNYWSRKKCRLCPLFPVEWCGTCKSMKFHGLLMACHNEEVFFEKAKKGKIIPRKDSAWITRKKDCEQYPKHGCQKYERR